MCVRISTLTYSTCILFACLRVLRAYMCMRMPYSLRSDSDFRSQYMNPQFCQAATVARSWSRLATEAIIYGGCGGWYAAMPMCAMVNSRALLGINSSHLLIRNPYFMGI